MLHELKSILSAARKAQDQNITTALASVVALDGSSYRRPGVRMLVQSDGGMIGAVSGGCVEKEILRQAQSVFSDGVPKLMVYDGRYRLGCDGILYILIEPFAPSEAFYSGFEQVVSDRKPFTITSYFSKEEAQRHEGGSFFSFDGNTQLAARSDFDPETASSSGLQSFEQTIDRGFRLIIAGAEHDTVALSNHASLTGWEVCVVAPLDEDKSAAHFPGADSFSAISEEEFATWDFDEQTAVMIMMHGLVKDLRYLSVLKDKPLGYLGLLGPSRRREKIINELLEHDPETPLEFIESIHGPAGINIGAETPQEIAISILSEILSVIRQQWPIPLKDKEGGIHQ